MQKKPNPMLEAVKELEAGASERGLADAIDLFARFRALMTEPKPHGAGAKRAAPRRNADLFYTMD